MPDHPIRKNVRLAGHDYATPGAYFITVCTHRRACLFGEVHDGHVHLSLPGDIVRVTWYGLPRHFPDVEVDALVIMPNHLHAILVLQPSVGAKHPELLDASPLRVYGILLLQRPSQGIGLNVPPEAIQIAWCTDDVLEIAALPDGRAGRAAQAADLARSCRFECLDCGL